MTLFRELRLGERRSSNSATSKTSPPHSTSLALLFLINCYLRHILLQQIFAVGTTRVPKTNCRVTTADRRAPTMDQHDDFDSVSWKHDPDSDASRPTTAGTDAAESSEIGHDINGKRRMSSAHEESQAGPLADAVDLAGIGDGVLECQVDSPLKENDGTKDAYISYLVTTHVCALFTFTAAAWMLRT